jgi:iron complex transport system ATP-binding protein
MLQDKSGLFTKQLDIAYDNRLIVDDLNLSIPIGKITALVGSNGSGNRT